MTGTSNLPTPLREEDYEAIEAAVMETARGRWFLAEYTRRHRSSDTRTVLDAIDRLEKTIGERTDVTEIDAMKRVILDVDTAISRAKAEICAATGESQAGLSDEASEELDSIVKETEKATSEILLIAESIQETAWTMREQGADEEQCAKLDQDASRIYTACSFQDLTGQRTAKIVQALRYAEGRLNAVVDLLDLTDEPTSSPHEGHAPAHQTPEHASTFASDAITLEADPSEAIITLDPDIVEPEELDFGTVSAGQETDHAPQETMDLAVGEAISLDDEPEDLPTETFDALEKTEEALEANAFADAASHISLDDDDEEDVLHPAALDGTDFASLDHAGTANVTKGEKELSLSDIEEMPEGQKLALFS